MDLFVTILQFLFGMPAQAEPIVVLADGRTSCRSQRLAMQMCVHKTFEGPTLRQRSLKELLDLTSFSERLSHRLHQDPRSRFCCQFDNRSSRF
jgi:hypothetical protein